MKGAVQSRPSAALSSFDAVLESGEKWLLWIDGAEVFHAVMKDKIPWAELDAGAKTVVQARMKTPAPAIQLMLNSLYLTMVSAFEEFLRCVILETAAQLKLKKLKYDEVSPELRNLHLRESARLLKRLDSPPDYLNVTVADLCAAIGSCVPGSDAVMLCEQALSDVEALIKLESFMVRMSALGRPMSFDILGGDAGVSAALNLSGAKTRSVAKALEASLGVISRNRNRIAHMGTSAADVDRTILEEHRKVLKAISVAVCAASA